MGDPEARSRTIGETEHEAREVMIEGVSGGWRCTAATSGRNGSRRGRRLEWTNGAVAQVFSGREP